jgi:hypothetical protein
MELLFSIIDELESTTLLSAEEGFAKVELPCEGTAAIEKEIRMNVQANAMAIIPGISLLADTVQFMIYRQ